MTDIFASQHVGHQSPSLRLKCRLSHITSLLNANKPPCQTTTSDRFRLGNSLENLQCSAVLQLVSASEIGIQIPASGSSGRIGLQHLNIFSIASRRCASCKLVVPKRFEVLPHSQRQMFMSWSDTRVMSSQGQRQRKQRPKGRVFQCGLVSVAQFLQSTRWLPGVGAGWEPPKSLRVQSCTTTQIGKYIHISSYIYACHNCHSYLVLLCNRYLFQKPSCSIVHVTFILSKHSQETNGFSMLMTNHGGFLDKLTTTLTKTPVL